MTIKILLINVGEKNYFLLNKEMKGKKENSGIRKKNKEKKITSYFNQAISLLNALANFFFFLFHIHNSIF